MLSESLFAQLSAAAPLRLKYDVAALRDFAAWSAKVRARLEELLRRDRWPSGGAKVTVEAVERCDGFERRRLWLEAGALFSGGAYMLVPHDNQARPGLLCLHGHGGYMAGKDMVAGVTETHPIALECAAALNYGYGVELARAGYVTLCPDAFNFGERLLPKDRWSEKHVCDDYFHALALYGYSPLGISVATNVLWVDYLSARAEVMPRRLGCVGLSYGGIAAVFTMVVDERLKAGVISGALHSMVDMAAATAGRGGCGSQTVPGMFEWFDFSDLALSLAPRPILYELMQQDCCFDFRQSRTLYDKIAGVYVSLGFTERCQLDTPDTDHRYSGALTPGFLSSYL